MMAPMAGSNTGWVPMRPLRSTMFLVVLCATLALTGSVGAYALDDGDAPATSADAVQLSFTDVTGTAQESPYFSVAGAYPGMTPRSANVTLTNRGAFVVGYDLTVVVTNPEGGPEVADVLVAEVLDGENVAYHGPLSELAVAGGAPLDPGASLSYRVVISWPDRGASDNAYQGVSTQFDFVARSWEASS